MRTSLLALGLAACCTVHAQGDTRFDNVYVGLGLTSIFTAGYAKPINDRWGLRGELAITPQMTFNDSVSSGSASFAFKSRRLGLFADWFPFDNHLRLVGGLTFNDIRSAFTGTSAETNFVTINNKKVSLGGETYSASLTFPAASPYIGVGLGHNPRRDRGVGFYADVGLMVGSFSTSINTSLLNKPVLSANGQTVVITPADLEQESKLVRDAISSLGILPSVSLGLVYRF